ncbi:hypothetical protein AKJ51_04270 [candidate division MSBL1 archaeon SCGC-AAA382A20]|uniref:Toprim domain-containing protein n=1 Tax=candidate division MSBL1 archaeon SCGC-AAA382A20 TaxID=1698280 RepID=A0A133VI15_9EURY|nr:hypothetical protein AKJ51_04270 [candidate division MSBL1 archaeon SCGC-AAA382A20]
MRAMLEPEVFEELENTLQEIREVSEEGTPIIVEGKKDEKSLRELDISGPIYQVPNRGQTMLKSLEDLPKYDEAIILTDFDRTGENLAEFCEKQLEKLGVSILFNLRDRLRGFVRKPVKDIEGMASFIKRERAAQLGHVPEGSNFSVFKR